MMRSIVYMSLLLVIVFQLGRYYQGFYDNAWYGSCTKTLVTESIRQLKADCVQAVVKSFEELERSYLPTYENRSHYDELVARTVSRMNEGVGCHRSAVATP